MTNAISLPRTKRRRPFGPREKRALRWLCIAVVFIAIDFANVAGDMAASHFDFWTVFDTVAVVVWVRLIIPIHWKVIRAWLDSGGEA